MAFQEAGSLASVLLPYEADRILRHLGSHPSINFLRPRWRNFLSQAKLVSLWFIHLVLDKGLDSPGSVDQCTCLTWLLFLGPSKGVPDQQAFASFKILCLLYVQERIWHYYVHDAAQLLYTRRQINAAAVVCDAIGNKVQPLKMQVSDHKSVQKCGSCCLSCLQWSMLSWAAFLSGAFSLAM